MLPMSDDEESLLLHAADDPFMLQVLAALRRLGKDAQTLVRDAAGLKKVSAITPKTKIGKVPSDDFEGKIVWAPQHELFSNSQLSEHSLDELRALGATGRPLYVATSQNSYAQIQALALAPSARVLFLPALVGFGDENFFESIFDSLVSSHSYASLPADPVMGLNDGVALVLSLVLNQKMNLVPARIWAEGRVLVPSDVTEGLADFAKVRAQSIVAKKIKGLFGKIKPWSIEKFSASAPRDAARADEVFPAHPTPWRRFFRDSMRIYEATPDGAILLHFPPSRAP